MFRRKPVLEPPEDRLPVESPHRLRRAQNRPAQRVVRPESSRKNVVQQILRIIQVHFDFFEHHLPLFLYILRVELRPLHQIRQHVKRDRQVFVEHLGVETYLFLGRECVQHPPNRIHFPGDIFGAAPIGTLKNHVFEEMSEAVFKGHFAAGAATYPNAHRNGTDVLHGLGDDHQAVGQNLTLNVAYLGDHDVL